MKRSIAIMIVSVFVFSSCQKKLTKDEAFNLIVGGGYMKVIERDGVSLYENFQPVYFMLNENFCEGATMCSEPWISDCRKPWNMVSERDMKVLEKLEKHNFIKIADSSDFSSCCVKRLVAIKPLKDSLHLMEKYSKIEELTKGDFIRGNCTGTFLRIQTVKPRLNLESFRLKVVEDEKKVEVEFSITIVRNEIGQKIYEGADKNREYWYVATIEMYDKGWEVSNIKKLVKDF